MKTLVDYDPRPLDRPFAHVRHPPDIKEGLISTKKAMADGFHRVLESEKAMAHGFLHVCEIKKAMAYGFLHVRETKKAMARGFHDL